MYEGEGALFYDDHSGEVIQDDVLMRLMTFPNAIVSGHQAFFTEEALHEIADCTLRNLDDFNQGRDCKNALVKSTPAAQDSHKVLARRDSLPVRNV